MYRIPMTTLAALLPALILTTFPAAAGPADASGASKSPVAKTVTAAVEEAREGRDFHLLAHCSDENGYRSLEVFPGAVAIWNGRTQVVLGETVRNALLDTLLSRGFPALEASYGGKPTQETPDGPAPASPGEAGPLRIRCRVTFESGEVSKTSIQQMDGEQSAKLKGLVTALLDRVEPLAAEKGVGAEDLEDGLARVARGDLAPQVFSLRFVRLAPPGSDEAGVILRVTHGEVIERPYAPGREVGEPVGRELSRDEIAELVEKLRKAQVSSLPVNLYAARHQELEVRVLQHQKTVIARPFAGLSRQEKGEAQERFDTLVDYLRRELLEEGEPPADEPE